MTTYTAIPNSDIDASSPVTESLLTLMRDNPLAQFEGDGSAPAFGSNVIDTTQIVASAVGRSEIANSVTTSAGSINNGANLDFALNDWALFPMVHHTQDTSMGGHSTDGTSAASPRFNLRNDSGVNGSYDVDHRWIIAA